MTDDERQIRALIERWAAAVHTGDMDDVLADHADDIVMFDVPPPYEGVRGIDAYRETWPPFFEWQARGASFEIESLDVTAGSDVAYAYALLRCGTAKEFADNPANRLRLTLGLRKQDGRWVVAHEHHSFPYTEDGEPAPTPSPIEVVPAWDPQAGRFAAELQGKDHGDPGLSVILVDAEPGKGPSLHRHDYAEMMIVLEGRATFTDGTDNIEVTAGHVAFVPAGTPHGFTNSGDGPLKQIDVHVADAFLTEWLD